MLTLREKTNKQLEMLLIETYLRYGFKSVQFQAVRDTMYDRGFERDDVVKLLIASKLYRSTDNFYRKHESQL